MFSFWNHRGILGINARNLLYIKPLNKKSQIKFADDKIRTKQYLSARGVNVARLLGKISTEQEILKFNWDSLPNDFVLKPNSGYGGEGIVVVTQRTDDYFLTPKKEKLTQEDLIEHVTDVLEGRYSISSNRDTVFFEQRLIPHPKTENLAKYGIPDIRIIVYNMVPVMAMVRVPTPESNGKANIHMGGLALGIDLAKGEVSNMAHYGRIIQEHPQLGQLRGIKIPFWNDVLLQATQIQQLVTLGYLAVDIVIDAQLGPTLLEINARAGLAVQIANLAPLRGRLDRVSGVKVTTPEKGVRMAQDLFGNKIERSIQAISGKKVIGLDEEMTLNLKTGTEQIMGHIDPSIEKNYIDENVFLRLAKNAEEESLTLNFTLAEERGKGVFYPLDLSKKNYDIVLGKKLLYKFYVDVSKPQEPTISIPDATPSTPAISAKSTIFNELRSIDRELCHIDRQLSLIASVRPLNLLEEKERFFKSKTSNPKFVYRENKSDYLHIVNKLEALNITQTHPVTSLFIDKKQELLDKAKLIELIGDDEVFPQACQKFFGMPKKDIILEAIDELQHYPQVTQNKEKKLSYLEAILHFEQFFKEKTLDHWEAKSKRNLVSRCVIGKNNRLLVREGETFSLKAIKKLIAHEIETHVYCTENGKLQPFQLLARGTAHYLKTQEGLAVYHQSEVIDQGSIDAALGCATAYWSNNMSFRDVFNRLRDIGVEPGKAWKTTVKAKRGLSNTAHLGGFVKNCIYYWGYKEVSEYIKQGGDYSRLFCGKFNLQDIDIIMKIPGLKPARYLPETAIKKA